MTAQERIALMGRLWDSLDSAVSAPITPSLSAELARREAESDADPAAGTTWQLLRDRLHSRLP